MPQNLLLKLLKNPLNNSTVKIPPILIRVKLIQQRSVSISLTVLGSLQGSDVYPPY